MIELFPDYWVNVHEVTLVTLEKDKDVKDRYHLEVYFKNGSLSKWIVTEESAERIRNNVGIKFPSY
ncbi:hypothetical protein [Lentilactobacillus senioris]|uniref:hypothetical protein n=1 Tax=Lentilactobacillus senioris TaxID=931534 RepID=UPI003D2D6F8F